jgi:undecaprenyl diphosphate synthase
MMHAHRPQNPPAPDQPASLARHVAIIMDGNGRWATRRLLPRVLGHERGAEAVRRTVTAARRMGLQALTLFAFSEQNWARPTAEVGHLMALFRRFLARERAELLRTGVRLCTIGDRSRLPAVVRAELEETEAVTRHNQGLTLCIAVSYGAREDMVQAMRSLATRVRAGELDPNDLDEDRISGALSSHALPPVDLLIRTSGEQRLSNFLLWEAAYAELYFTPCLWPDFDEGELATALHAFSQRDRRFGAIRQAV